MATIGERLTEARKNLGIDVRTAAEATKIRSDFLVALEGNKPENINLTDVYKVGFLRIYAKFLRLDADRMVAEFRTQLSLHGTPTKGGYHLATAAEETAGTASASGLEKSGLFSEGEGVSPVSLLRRYGVIIVVAVVVLAAFIFAVVEIFGGNGQSETETVAAAEAPTPDTQQYEFRVVSKVPQRVSITDRYKAADGKAGAKLLDGEMLAANAPRILVGRGVLEIRDSGGKNLEIRFPSKKALLASEDANVPVKLTEENEGLSFSHAANYWTADPYAEAR